MSKIKRVLRCFSCGAVLQTDDTNLPGYISKEVLEKTNPKIPYCNECYEKIIRLNSGELEDNIDKDIIKVLDDAVATDAVIIWVTDLSSFNGSLNKSIVRKIRTLKVAVLATKRELYSPKIDNSVFVRFIEERFSEAGIKPFSVRIISEKELNTAYQSESILETLNNLRKGHDVYMLGASTSGKSSIVSRILKDYENKSKWTIRSEIYPETEAKVLEIPLTNSAFFYELPDLSQNDSIISKVEKEVLKQITPHKYLEITNKSVSSEEAIMIGNLGLFELRKGRATKVSFYAAKAVEYKKVSAERVDEAFKDNLKRRFVRPVSEKLSLFTDFDVFELTMDNDGRMHDISITGLVTASFIARGQIIRITLPHGVSLKESLAKIR